MGLSNNRAEAWKKSEEATAVEPATEAEEIPALLPDEEVDGHTEPVSKVMVHTGASIDLSRPGLLSFMRSCTAGARPEAWLCLAFLGVTFDICVSNCTFPCASQQLIFERPIWMKVNLELGEMGILSGWSGPRWMDRVFRNTSSARV